MTNLVMQRKMIGWTVILAVGTLTGFLSFAVFEAAVATGAPPLLPGGGSGPRGVLPGVPMQINHQGVVQSGGIRFNGNGLFRFAIVDPDTGNQVWTNDGTNTPGPGAPTAAVSVTVTNGVYSVLLGDTSLTNMTAVPGSNFSDGNLVLRIWFDDGSNGVQQLAPDHALSTSPYAFRSVSAIDADTVDGLHASDLFAPQPPIGSIVAWHKNLSGVPALSSNWVECNGQTISDAGSPLNGQSIPDLNGQGRFLRGATTSGSEQTDSTRLPSPFATDENTTLHTHPSPDHNHSGIPTGTDNQQINSVAEFGGNGMFGPPLSTTGVVGGPGPTGSQSANHTHIISATGDPETRPINMSVVWIMRIK